MANNFAISISCVDNATRTINRISDSVAKMTRPYANLGRAASQFSKTSGLTQLGTSMGKAASEAGNLAKQVGLIAAPMTALIGGGTIAGICELAKSWATLGGETARTSQILGVSAQSLDAMRNSAQLMGVSGDTMTSGFRSFADTLQDARWGRNQGAAAMLQHMGIQLHQTKTGAIDAERAMIDFADKVKQVQQRDPAAARKLASSFGVEALLPVLMKGGAALKEYQVEAARLSGVKTPEMIERASSFALSIQKMGLAAGGMKTAIADKLIPVMEPLIKQWTEWLVINREPIGKKFAEVAERIGSALKGIDLNKVIDGIGKFVIGCIDLAKWVDHVVESTVGWKAAIIGAAVVMAGSFVASTVLSIVQLGILITNLGLAAAAYIGLGAAAKTAAAAQTMTAAEIAAKQTMMGAEYGGSTVAAGVAEWLESLALKALPYARAATGVGLALHSGALNKGEDKQTSAMNSGSTTSDKMISFFEGKGWSKNQAIGIAANIKRESHYDPEIVGDKGHAYGYGQWHEDRQAQFTKLYGHRMQDGKPEEQLEFYDWELRHGDYKPAGDKLSRANGAGESAAIVSSLFERPKDEAGEMNKRAQIAENMAQRQPQINVQVQTNVDKQGGVHTRVTTPAGVKIAHTSPVMA